jgi:hypothetical protein
VKGQNSARLTMNEKNKNLKIRKISEPKMARAMHGQGVKPQVREKK